MTKWRNEIIIKEQLNANESDNEVLRIIEKLLHQLNYVVRREKIRIKGIKSTLSQEYLEASLNELEALIIEFEWIQDSIINEKDPEEFEYSNWCEAFNNYFEELYSIGDEVISYTDLYNKERFLWVG